MHSWEQSFANPAASTAYGFMEPPDLAKFGRSEQLHAALFGIQQFVINNNKYPGDSDADRAETLKMTNARLEELKASGGHQVELEAEVFNKAVSYAGCSISPMSAFFGGIVAQEIVKFTGKYTPLKQWLHFDIYETLPREDSINRKLSGSRHDDQIAIYG